MRRQGAAAPPELWRSRTAGQRMGQHTRPSSAPKSRPQAGQRRLPLARTGRGFSLGWVLMRPGLCTKVSPPHWARILTPARGTTAALIAAARRRHRAKTHSPTAGPHTQRSFR